MDEMFRIACGPLNRDGWALAPSEFWLMCPHEWWLLYDAFVGDRIKAQEDDRERLNRLYDRYVKK
jgi:hypothetical protein